MFSTSLVLGIVLVACSEQGDKIDSGTTNADPLAIAGTYQSNFGATWVISNRSLSVDYGTPDTYAIVAYDNTEQTMVAQNGSTNTYNPDLWSRFDWVVDGETIYICQQLADGETRADAESTKPADPTDPTKGGCGTTYDFPFTALTTP